MIYFPLYLAELASINPVRVEYLVTVDNDDERIRTQSLIRPSQEAVMTFD